MTSEKYHRVINLKGGAEVIQVAFKNSEISGNKIKDIEWPYGSALVAVLRGQEAFVPTGDDDLQDGDTVFAITVPEARKKLVNLLSH